MLYRGVRRGVHAAATAGQEAARLQRPAEAARPSVRVQLSRPPIVDKWGGSSVGSATAIRHVGDILQQQQAAGLRPISVSSALFGVTDRLIEATKAASAGRAEQVGELRATLMERHMRVADDLLGPESYARGVTGGFTEHIFRTEFDAVLDRLLQEGGGELRGNELDIVSSIGERLSTFLLTQHLIATGRRAVYVPSESIIVTDGVPGNAQPLLDATAQRIEAQLGPLLQRDVIPCVTGFYGASVHDGAMLTTFGRGGSDLTAAVVGYAVRAAEVNLYKVEYTKSQDGFLDEWRPGYSGIVHDADHQATIPTLSYQAAAQLACYGKKVIHPDTVKPALLRNIPVVVRNTLHPDGPCTVITSLTLPAAASPAPTVESIAKVSLATFEEKNRVRLRPPRIASQDNSLVAVCGANVMAKHDHLTALIRATLLRDGIPCDIPDFVNGSPDALAVVVPTPLASRALALLHDAFFRHATATGAGPRRSM